MRKVLKWVLIICLIPVALILLLAILLYVPPIQNFVINKAIGYANQATGMDISVQRVRIGFPLKLDVKGVQVLLSPADTVLTAQHLTAHIKPFPLLKKEVEFGGFNLESVTLNSDTLIDGIWIKGRFTKLDLDLDVLKLNEQQVKVHSAGLSDALLFLEITEPTKEKDTTSAPTAWQVDVGKISLTHVNFDMKMPADTLNMSAYIDQADLSDASVDLLSGMYTGDKFTLSKSSFSYNRNNLQPATGFDPAHIVLQDMEADMSALVYSGNEINAEIGKLSFNERSGLSLVSLEGNVHSDSVMIQVPDLHLKTTESELRLMANVPWRALDSIPSANIKATIRGNIGKNDLIHFAGNLPRQFKEAYPETPLSLTANVEGNLDVIQLRQLKAEMRDAFTLTASGTLRNITDENRRSGNAKISAETRDMRFVNSLLPPETRSKFRIPPGVKLSADVGLVGNDYRGRLLLTESAGTLQVNGQFDMDSQSYSAQAQIRNLQPNHFLPKDSLMFLTASLQANGRGTDIYSSSTRANISGTVDKIQYASTVVNDLTLKGTLLQNKVHLDLEGTDPNLDIDLAVDGTLQKNYIDGIIVLEANHIDFERLNLIQDTIATTFSMYAEVATDLKQDYKADLTIGNWELATPQRTYRPKLVTLHAVTNVDTTRLSLHNGDLGVILTGNSDPQSMISQFTTISKEISTQLERDTMIAITTLEPLLPDAHLEVSIGSDNLLYSYLQQQEITFNRIFADVVTSPDEGINLDAGVYTLNRDTLRIDTVQIAIRPDSAGLHLLAEIEKNRYRNQAPFTASVDGHLRDQYADAEINYKNDKDETGILLGVKAQKESGGIHLNLFPDNPILAFRSFNLNSDNYILYRNNNDIRANVRLTGENNASIWIHSEPQNGPMQDIHAELSHLDLDLITQGFPQLPSMEGMLDADLSYAPSDSSFMVVADIHVDTLVYNNGRVGEITANAVYLPLGNGEQQLDVHLFRDSREVVSATAHYQAGTPAEIDGSITIDHLPMAMISPFIPDDMARLSGAMNGDMTISGTTEKPDLNGYLQMDTAAVYVTLAGTNFRLDDQRIEVNESLISFNQYKIYSESNDPFTVDGSVNIGNVADIRLDLAMNASNMELLDAKRTSESLVYGKLVIDLNSTIKGSVNDLAIRGNVHLLGNTNVTYVLTESPLTVQDRMDGLVTFVNFADTFSIRDRNREVTPLGGIDMLFVVTIDQAVQLNVDLTPDQSNRVELIGGGDLTYQSNSEGIMVLNGTYSLTGGTISYTLPVVPLKDFNIHDGSYVTWNGNVLDPEVNITATERVRASVVSEDGGSRLVNFDVGIKVTGTLEDLALNFTLDAPDDGSVQNELTAMGPEEESRQAVGMLITGRYLAGGSNGDMNFDMGSALNSFLQNEIGNIAGDALKSVDISFDMDTYNDDGESRTDYSFKFAKRFYNDRIQVVIGGRVSTGSDFSGETQSFIDDVSIEYRLDNSGTRYVKVFHDTNYESVLEGEITETGVGLVLRKKMRYLRELFIFRKNKNKPVASTTENLQEKNENTL